MSRRSSASLVLLLGLILLPAVLRVDAGGRPQVGAGDALDRRVRAFLDEHRHSWYDMNVPEADGRILHDLILKNGYTRALEIGTSTGHSGIWMAWALSKTGGKLITIEIDEGRFREAVANFKDAGLAAFVDARRADAHELVPALEGPFDFVFIDADKEWYADYARAVIPKLAAGGCIAAHNVQGGRGRRRGGMGTGDYYDLMAARTDFETSIHPDSWSGLALSYKKK